MAQVFGVICDVQYLSLHFQPVKEMQTVSPMMASGFGGRKCLIDRMSSHTAKAIQTE
jgi:hypothetical protein